MVIDSKPDDHVVICMISRKYGRMWANVHPDELLSLVERDNGIYEVICSYPHKVYFDIDADNKDYDILEKIIPKINELFPDSQMAISGSKSDVRQSYHIVLNNYMITSEKERNHIKSMVKFLRSNYDDSFDDKVYTNNRLMKCINQSKGDNRYQEIIINQQETKHFITCNFNQTHLDLPNLVNEPEMTLEIDIETTRTQKFNVGIMPKMILKLGDCSNFDINNFTPLEALNILPINKDFDHAYTHLIARYCFYSGLTFEVFYSWYKNKKDNNDSLNKWKNHWTSIARFPEVSNDKIMTIIIKYYPSIKREKHFENFKNLFNLDQKQIVKVPTLTQDIFTDPSKFTVINTGMGSGKTFQTSKYLKNVDEFIWITPNIALSQNTTQRLRDDGINVSHYKDFKTSSSKLEMIPKQDKLMICLNSLMYCSERKYKVVVIDEIETFLNKWFNNETITDNISGLWETFINIIKNAEKVIFLDAFTSNNTINFIKSITDEKTHNDIKIIELNDHNVNRTIHTKPSFNSWVGGIIDKLNENKKVFIFYPYKNGGRSYPSMIDLKTIIEQKTGKSGISYNADVDDVVLETLNNVNEHWSKSDFVLTNNKINVGINYEQMDFDSVFMACATFNSPRDIIQVSYRCRNLKSNDIFMVHLNGCTNNNVMMCDELVKNCSIYKQLQNDIIIEQFAPLKTTLNHFYRLAHYKISYSKEAINKDLDTYIKKLFEDCELGYSYDTINNITYTELEDLQQKIYNMEATLDEKITVKKHFYRNQFKAGSNDEYLSIGWDKNYIIFFNKVKDLMHNKDHLFNKIYQFNNWTSILPSDSQINKSKLNAELIDEIFVMFKFKDLTKKSSANNIIKNIYNSYFNKTIIKSKCDDNKHYKLIISDEVREMLCFGIQNLKLYEKIDFDFGFNTDLVDAGIVD